MTASVIAVSRSGSHSFTKPNDSAIRLLAGLGVEGDAHLGELVKHRSNVRKDPSKANMRQVHLIHGELQDELRAAGFRVAPGVMGENITTRGIDLLALPVGARLRLGAEAVIEVTGLRKPCHQLDGHQAGLMAAVIGCGADGKPIYKCGVMAIVVSGGEVRAGDDISIILPPEPHRPLAPV